MIRCIVIRGPMACGKSTISKALSEVLNAKVFTIDRIVEGNNLDEWLESGYVSLESFLKGNLIAIEESKKELEKKNFVIINGNFYYKEQIEDLVKKLPYPIKVFTLKLPVDICVERDLNRDYTHGEYAVRGVYRKSASFEYGIPLNIEGKSVEEVVKLIKEELKK